MTIATLNIDWAKTYQNKTHIHKIEAFLNKLDLDIIILTESVDLDLPAFKYIYKTKQIPSGSKYEELDYSEYLNGNPAYRATIYSKFESSRSHMVTDDFTSLCKEFDTSVGTIAIYATIVGTWFNKGPYAQKELNNCIADCRRISQKVEYFCLSGDLNTSFLDDEKKLQIVGLESRKQLIELCNSCKLDLTTKILKNNIDHILLSKSLVNKLSVFPKVFVDAGVLSDHQGVLLDMNQN